MNRLQHLERLKDSEASWDVLIVGGGATGLSIALDAALRGYRTALVEGNDFAHGTSSRSTKLIHGGVRYLRQGQIGLVLESVRERGRLCRNAPHLVTPLPFLVPAYHWWDRLFYGIGLKLYDAMAGRRGLAPTRIFSKRVAMKTQPGLNGDGLRGGVCYFDAQFDDARLTVCLAQTAARAGATIANHVMVDSLLLENGKVAGANLREPLTGDTWPLSARLVVNATGPFADSLRMQSNASAQPILRPSQGIHLVFDGDFLPGESALMIPKTEDGRVLFAIPWLGKVLLGTTDTPIEQPVSEPLPQEKEIRYLLEHIAPYLKQAPTRADIRAIYAGLRPLVSARKTSETKSISREHTIEITREGLFTICGGKWTTCRQMAEDAVDKFESLVDRRPSPCQTANHSLVGAMGAPEENRVWRGYGSLAPRVREIAKNHPEWLRPFHPNHPYCEAHLRWAVREEMACTIEDLLSRRTRLLILDARAAESAIPIARRVLKEELGLSDKELAEQENQFKQRVWSALPSGNGEDFFSPPA